MPKGARGTVGGRGSRAGAPRTRKSLATAAPAGGASAEEGWDLFFRNVVRARREEADSLMYKLLAEIDAERLPLDELSSEDRADFPGIVILWSMAHEHPEMRAYRLDLLPDEQKCLEQAATLARFVMSMNGVLRNIENGNLGRAAAMLALRHLTVPNLKVHGRPAEHSRDLIRLRAERLIRREPALAADASRLAAEIRAGLESDGISSPSVERVRKILREMGFRRPLSPSSKARNER